MICMASHENTVRWHVDNDKPMFSFWNPAVCVETHRKKLTQHKENIIKELMYYIEVYSEAGAEYSDMHFAVLKQLSKTHIA